MKAIFVGCLIFYVMAIMGLEIQGHRGTAHAPENTLISFLLAVDEGADSIELDVQCSADKQLFIAHNSFLKQDEKELAVRDMPYEKIKSLSSILGNFPLLEEVLEYFAARKAAPIIDIEIKLNSLTLSWSEILNHLLPLVDRYKDRLHVRLRSFEYACINYLVENYSGVQIGLLTDEHVHEWPSFLDELKIDFIAPHISTLFACSVQHAHNLKVKVIPWTANTFDEFEFLYSCKVDGITTDYPKKLKEFLATKG
jgi:glycerophosphoryl diester phosphodiesterase